MPVTAPDLPPQLHVCAFCGGIDMYENPLAWDTWGLSFVSEPFPAHRGCAQDYLYERVTEAEMREALA